MLNSNFSTLQIIQNCQEKMTILLNMISYEQLQKRSLEIDVIINNNDLWNNVRRAANIMKERTEISDILSKLKYFKETSDFNSEFALISPGEIESLRSGAEELYNSMLNFEFQQMMKDPTDNLAAIFTISAGAGGLESANFVNMLLRMYFRYANNFNFKTELLDIKCSEEHSSICLDSVSFRVEGPYAYGYLKGESGVHRMIRNSPFNANGQRHTSFAGISVTPDIEDSIEIKIEDKDIEITAQTAGGPGGQNQNRIKSAIRLKHLPTGINILVRTERDQLSNKKTAFKMLKAKLYEIELKKKEEEKNKNLSGLSNVSFGSQIKTYTESPYSLVKDHRTNYEIKDFNRVLDGDIHDFLLAYLRFDANSK